MDVKQMEEAVTALLATMEEIHKPNRGVIAELCRTWLAVHEGPRVAITECNQIPGASDFDFGDMSHACQQFKPGQTVALVPVPVKEGKE